MKNVMRMVKSDAKKKETINRSLRAKFAWENRMKLAGYEKRAVASLKQILLEIAAAGLPCPNPNTLLGMALAAFTTE